MLNGTTPDIQHRKLGPKRIPGIDIVKQNKNSDKSRPSRQRYQKSRFITLFKELHQVFKVVFWKRIIEFFLKNELWCAKL